jgi:two-component system response regulator FixJ
MSVQAGTVFVIDDDADVRRSLHELMVSASLPVESFDTSQSFLDALDPGRPGCLVLDLRLKEGSGLDLQDELRRRKIGLPIIVLTGHGDVPSSVRSLKAGAFDFLQKPTPPAVLLERVRAALECDRAEREQRSLRTAGLDRLASLTPREREVMTMLVAGATSKEVAYDLEISVRTVEGHRRRVLSKLQVTSAAQLVRAVMMSHGESDAG